MLFANRKTMEFTHSCKSLQKSQENVCFQRIQQCCLHTLRKEINS